MAWVEIKSLSREGCYCPHEGPIQQVQLCYICSVTDTTMSWPCTSEGKKNEYRNLLERLLKHGLLKEWGKGNLKMNETHWESYLHLMFSCCSWFRSHGSPNKHSMLPTECFINQWYSQRPAPSKQDGINWHSFWVFPWGVNNGALGCRWTESVSVRTCWGSYAY